MERFGILEMEQVADIHRMVEARDWKYIAFRRILDNNFNRVPEGWTVVFMRNTPVQIVPDSIVKDIMSVSLNGFAHDQEGRCLVCFYDANKEDGRAFFRSVMDIVVGWLDANMF